MQATAKPWTKLRIANTIFSCGVNLLIERFNLDPRWKYLVWMLIAANEIRGAFTVYGVVHYGGVF